MNEPWFNAMYYGWIPGTLLGCLGGLWGSLLGVLAPRGRGKVLLLSMGSLLVATALGCLTAGVYGWQSGQPSGVWYGLLLPGVLGVVVVGPLLVMAVKAYRMAEERRMDAQDFS
jgi:hypothetical protein